MMDYSEKGKLLEEYGAVNVKIDSIKKEIRRISRVFLRIHHKAESLSGSSRSSYDREIDEYPPREELIKQIDALIQARDRVDEIREQLPELA